EEAARFILEKARHYNVPLVLTTRAPTAPEGYGVIRHELEPLEEPEPGGNKVSVQYVDDRSAAPLPQAKALAKLIEVAGLAGKPVYLNLLARLCDLASPAL